MDGIIKVNNACITKLQDKYRFGYDGFRIELTPEEAHHFYLRMDRALSTYSSDFLTVNVKVADRYFCISREQIFQMLIEMRADEKTGKALWYN